MALACVVDGEGVGTEGGEEELDIGDYAVDGGEVVALMGEVAAFGTDVVRLLALYVECAMGDLRDRSR